MPCPGAGLPLETTALSMLATPMPGHASSLTPFCETQIAWDDPVERGVACEQWGREKLPKVRALGAKKGEVATRRAFVLRILVVDATGRRVS